MIKLDFKKINHRKIILPLIVVAVLAAVFIFTPHSARALDVVNSLGSLVVSLLSWLFQTFVYVFGTLLVKAIEILIKVLSYSDFLNAPIVAKGWTVIRDTCNIGITITLLMMSFYTIFRAKSYQYQTFLPKLVVAAVLINFSKVITGFFIDISQVFMMTFVNAFKDAAAGNLTYGFGMEDMLKFGDLAGRGLDNAGAVDLSANINNWSILGGEVLASLMVLVAFVVVLSLIVMMLVRIFYLWFLTLASPIAFLGNLIPGNVEDKLTKDWWSNLTKYLVQGPVVGFMLWLTFAVISEMTASKHIMVLQFQSQLAQGNVSTGDVGWQAFANKISGTQNIVDYLVTCGLLIFTLVVASKTGIAGSKIAGNFYNKLEGYGNKIIRTPQMLGGAAARRFGTSKLAQSGVAKLGQIGESKFVKALGLNKPYKQQKVEERKAWAQENFGGRIGAIRSQEKRTASARAEALKKVGMGDWTDKELADQFEKNRKGVLRGPLAVDSKATAQAMIMEMANRKGLIPDAMEKYQKDFGYNKQGKNLLDTTEGKNAAIFEIDAWKAQEKAGDTFAEYKKKIKYNIDRNTYEPYNAEDDIKDNLKKEIREISGDITAKTITGKLDENDMPKNGLELTYVQGLMQHHTQDIGKLDKAKRKFVAEGIKNMLANQSRWGISDEEAEKLKNFHQILTAKENTLNTKVGWFQGFEPKDIDRFGELETGEKANLGKRLDKTELEKTSRELKGKIISTMRGVAETGTEKPTSLDLAAAREIYNRDEGTKIGTKELIKAVDGVKEAIRKEDSVDRIKDEFESAVAKITGQIRNNTQTTQINPEKGRPYTEREMFDQSRLGRTISFINNTFATAERKPDGSFANDKQRKAVDHAMSYITAHVRGVTDVSKKALKEINGIRKDAQFFANKIGDSLGQLYTETDGKKRASIIAKAHQKANKMEQENEDNPDQNYFNNIKRLTTSIERVKNNNSLLTKKYLDDLQETVKQIRNYNF